MPIFTPAQNRVFEMDAEISRRWPALQVQDVGMELDVEFWFYQDMIRKHASDFPTLDALMAAYPSPERVAAQAAEASV